MALMRYIELAMIGDSLGMINGIYILETFKETLNMPINVWNYQRIYEDKVYRNLLKIQ
jgi:hypothetical protein